MKMITKNTLLFVGVIIFATITSIYFLERMIGTHLRESQAEWVYTLIESLSEGIARDTINGNGIHVREVIQKITDKDQAIEYIIVTDMEGNIFAHSFKEGMPRFLAERNSFHGDSSWIPSKEIFTYTTSKGDIWEFTVPLIEGLRAHIVLGMNENEISPILNRIRQSILLIMTIIGIFSSVIVFIVSRKISKPFEQYINQVLSYAKGSSIDFSFLGGKGWEVDQLIKTFNNVISTRESAEKKLRDREENLALTLDSIGDAVIVTDDKSQVSRINPVAERLTGWSAEQAKGLSINEIFRIIDATDRAPMENPVDRVLKTGEVVHLSNHTTLISRDRREYQIADSAAPIRGASGMISGVILVFNDVTEQYKLREAAKTTVQQLSSLMSDMQTMVAVLNAEGVISFINDTALRIALLQPDDVMGHALWECSWFNHSAEVQEMIRDDCVYGAQGIPTQRDVEIHTSRGLVWVDFRLHPIFDDQGTLSQIVTEWRDINEQYITRQALIKSEEEQKQILNSMANGVITISEIGKILFFNNTAEKMFDYTSDEVLGKNIKILMPEPYHSEHDQYLDNYMKGEEAKIIGFSREVKGITKSGQIFPIHLSVSELSRDATGNRRFIGSCLDRTEHQKQEEQIRRSQKMDALGKLTGGVAHDYNNMLGVIFGYSELMEMSLADNPKALGQIKKIRHAAERSAKLTRKLLSFSRGGSDHAKKIQINQVLAQISDMVSKSITARVELVLDLCEDPWPIWLDVDELEDLILNMSINAKHAMPDGGILTLKTETVILNDMQARGFNLEKGEYMRLSIVDTGTGIAEADLANIFDPFFTTKGEGGTGLGLSQVYRFVTNSGGSISVYSEIGEGTQFNILFPHYTKGEKVISKGKGTDPEVYNGTETLLIVDDEEALREMAVNILEPYGYKIFQADGGEAALEILADNEIHLMISDVIMPHMDGFELARQVMELYPAVKIQMISGFADNRDNKTGNEELHKNILAKPYRTSDLLRKIRMLLDEQ